MSTVARFVQLHVSKAQRLLAESIPIKRLFRKTIYSLDSYLERNGTERGFFDHGDGNYVLLALHHLKVQDGINLINADKALALMAKSLDKRQGGFHCFMTWEDREKYQNAEASRAVDFALIEKICKAEGLDPSLYTNLGTLLLAQEKVLSLLKGIPDEHLILLIAG